MKNGDVPVMLVYQRVRFNTIIIETGIEFLVLASMPTLLIFRKPQLFPKAGLSTEALCKQLGGQPSDFSDPSDSPGDGIGWDTRPGKR